MKTIDSLSDKNELNEMEYNTALAALINCTDESLVFKLLNKKFPGLKKDAITYTLMIRSCTRITDEERFVVVLNDLMNKVPRYCIDSKLLFEYCGVILDRKFSKPESQEMGLRPCVNISNLIRLSLINTCNLMNVQNWFH